MRCLDDEEHMRLLAKGTFNRRTRNVSLENNIQTDCYASKRYDEFHYFKVK